MTCLVCDFASAGWIAEQDIPVDVGLVDWAHVARLLDGHGWPTSVPRAQQAALTAASKVAVDVLVRAGESSPVIGERLGCSARHVERLRARPVVGRPAPILELLFGWTPPPCRVHVDVAAGRLRAAS